VNALFHMAKLSEAGGELRPGIVHRLDKQTSGRLWWPRTNVAHRELGRMFAAALAKTYIALLHGTLAKEERTVSLPVARDLDAADSDDHAARGWAQCGVALHGGGAAGNTLWRVHAG